MNVINPFGLVYFDMLYYLLLLGLGPWYLWDYFWFRPKRKLLHDAYRTSGVEIQGLVTQTKITVHRGALTGMERRREYQLRYAYKDPASETIVVKDFIHVKRTQLHQRLFTVLILPGQAHSGVPAFLIRDLSRTPLWITVAVLVGTSATVFCVYVFSFLVSIVSAQCQTNVYESTRLCYMNPLTILVAAILVIGLGFGLAWFMHRAEQTAVPGRVWKRVTTRRQSETTTPVSTVTVDLDHIDDRPIPIAQAAAILEDTPPTADEAANADVLLPSANAVLPSAETSLPEAKAVELV